MRWSYPLFRVYGISIELHITFLLFFLLVAFGDMQAFLFLVLVFTVVLAHELVHSITAVLHGVKVPKITLLPIGGLATIELPQDPLLELKVSAAGPIFNFVLAALGVVLLYSVDSSLVGFESIMSGFYSGDMGMNSVASVLSVIIYINFVLGAFNMLPAFPMDGGRVFRGVLALWVDYTSATRIATSVGKAIFTILVIAGILTFNIWWILIGLFLSYAGGSELRYVSIKNIMEGKTLSDIAAPPPPFAVQSLTLGQFLETVYVRASRRYVVVDSGGVLKKVLDMTEIQSGNPNSRLSELAGVNYAVADGSTPVVDAMKSIISQDITLVVEAGKLKGYITPETLAESISYCNLTRKRIYTI